MNRPAAVSLLISLVATLTVNAFLPAVYSQANLHEHRTPLSLSPTQNPRLPGPVTGNPGTAKRSPQNIINSKLLIYSRNGMGTTSTNTGGEFGAQLVTAAKVNNQFALQWSRTKGGKAEQAKLYIAALNSSTWLDGPSVTMPAQSLAVDIQYSIPNLAAQTYELKLVGQTGSSTKVTINYTGNDGNSQPAVVTPVSNGGPPTSTKTPIYITGASFTPMVGALGAPGYKRAKLTLTLRTTATTTISTAEADVESEPWTNPELLTSSSSKNSPITIFSGKWSVGGGAKKILPNQDNFITITLRANSKKDIQADETGPGFYSPSDWGFAFGQTATASFRWRVNGVAGTVLGSAEQSPKKPWQWGAP
jgi:hypothetical protein